MKTKEIDDTKLAT